jgi:hypothetical protein
MCPLKLVRKTANGDLTLDGVPVHIVGTTVAKTDLPVSGNEVGAGYFVGNDGLGIWDGIQWVYLGIPGMSDMLAIISTAVNNAATNYATAAQGAKADTAIQKETDPVYTVDKPTLALKAEVQAVADIANGKLDATTPIDLFGTLSAATPFSALVLKPTAASFATPQSVVLFMNAKQERMILVLFTGVSIPLRRLVQMVV